MQYTDFNKENAEPVTKTGSTLRERLMSLASVAVIAMALTPTAQAQANNDVDSYEGGTVAPGCALGAVGAANTSSRHSNIVSGRHHCLENNVRRNIIAGGYNTLGSDSTLNTVTGWRNTLGASNFYNNVSGAQNTLASQAQFNLVHGKRNSIGLGSQGNLITGESHQLGSNQTAWRPSPPYRTCICLRAPNGQPQAASPRFQIMSALAPLWRSEDQKTGLWAPQSAWAEMKPLLKFRSAGRIFKKFQKLS